jgi:hypothetical protein
LLLALVAAAPLLIGPGAVNTRAGGDVPFMWQRVHQLTVNLRAGIFPARWMPDGAFGLGYPAFNYYASLPYYLASLLDWAGLGVLWGLKLVQTLGFALAGVMSYLLARKIARQRAPALLASAVYTFAPFHLVNVYVRGDSLAEFFAMGLYPLIGWAVLRLCERPAPQRAAVLALSYALLVLSHNISALLFSPLVGLWLLTEALRRQGSERRQALIWGGVALGLGLLLSAWFWAPALRESALVQLGDQTTGYFNFAGHFRAANLVQGRIVHDYTIDGQRDPFSMGLAQALVAMLGLVAMAMHLLRRKRLPISLWVAALALVGYTWLMTPWSHWAWEHIPLLDYAQFPWRLLSVQALAVSLLVCLIPELAPRRARLALCLALAAGVAVAGMAGLKLDHLPVREGDITAERLMLYESYSGNIGATIRHEYLPAQMVPRPYTSGVQLNDEHKPTPLALGGQVSAARLLWRSPQEELWHLELAEPSLLAFHTTYLPGWAAWVDGQPTPVEPLPGLGQVGLRLEPGQHEVRLRFGPTRVRLYATWASLIAALACLGLASYPALASRTYRRWLACGLLAALALATWLAWGPRTNWPGSDDDLLVMDLHRAPYLHHEPDGLLFGEAPGQRAWLSSYQVSASELMPGGTLTLDVVWREVFPEARLRLRLVGAGAPIIGQAPVWAEVSGHVTSQHQQLQLPVPVDLAPGLYVLAASVRYEGDDLPISTPQGQDMARLALQPLQVIGHRWATGQEPVVATYGPENAPPVIALLEAQATQDEKDVEVRLTWRSERQAPLNYVLSVRLYAASGEQLAARDVAPLLGGYPTSLWQAGELVTDRVLLRLADKTPLEREGALEIVLYDRATLQSVGTVSLPLAEILR